MDRDDQRSGKLDEIVEKLPSAYNQVELCAEMMEEKEEPPPEKPKKGSDESLKDLEIVKPDSPSGESLEDVEIVKPGSPSESGEQSPQVEIEPDSNIVSIK